jgi:hypothetical protein
VLLTFHLKNPPLSVDLVYGLAMPVVSDYRTKCKTDRSLATRQAFIIHGNKSHVKYDLLRKRASRIPANAHKACRRMSTARDPGFYQPGVRPINYILNNTRPIKRKSDAPAKSAKAPPAPLAACPPISAHPARPLLLQNSTSTKCNFISFNPLIVWNKD